MMTNASPVRTPPPHRQRGVALFVVLVFVMLSMLLALWASRTSLFNELVVGNDADYQRAFEAAQALLQDAELDIRGEYADGQPYPTSGYCSGDVCRKGTAPYEIPLEAKDVTTLLAKLESQTPTRCAKGLCLKRTGRQDFWNATSSTALDTGEVNLAQMAVADVGARYGQFTGASIVNTTAAPSNPILANRSANTSGGWYWIEVLPYDESSETSALVIDESGNAGNLLPLNLTPSVVYRITALAYGLKPSTLVVLQETYAPQRLKD
ncbi:PilX N-terminal domain-containing pilus assembly protein [Ottowia sp.]|uniref:pilus assembly PilX family protein n=1 Tax=Ottowia sp. TaxID=1898956 RepID=UPI0039E4894C